MALLFGGKERLPLPGRSSIQRYFMAFTAVTLVTFAQFLIDQYLGYSLELFSFYYPAILMTAWYGGLGPSICATALSAAITAFYSPHNFLPVFNPGPFIQHSFFIIVSLTICLLTENFHRWYELTARKEIEEAHRKELKVAYEEMERRVRERTAQLAKINEALQEEILERRKVEKEVLEISEREQRRLGAQIHDDLCQSLTGIMILTKVLTQKMARKDLPESIELEKIGELLDQSITQAREMARGFYPVELQADSLMIALKDLASRTETLYGVVCHFFCPQPILIDDNNAATHLYRIVQEAVLNAVMHGKAKHVEIVLTQQDGQMILNVQDDGKGMTKEPEERVGIGLHIMRYRARMIDAALQINDDLKQGTVLTCSFSHPIRGVTSHV